MSDTSIGSGCLLSSVSVEDIVRGGGGPGGVVDPGSLIVSNFIRPVRSSVSGACFFAIW